MVVLTEQEKERILRAYNKGKTISELMKIFCYSRATITNYLRTVTTIDKSRRDIEVQSIRNENIVRDYRDGYVIVRQLAKKYGVSVAVVYMALKEKGIKPISANSNNLKYRSIVADYQNGLSINDLAYKYDYAPCTIYYILHKYNVDIEYVNRTTDKTQQIIDRLKDGGKLTEIAKEFNVSRQRVFQIKEKFLPETIRKKNI